MILFRLEIRGQPQPMWLEGHGADWLNGPSRTAHPLHPSKQTPVRSTKDLDLFMDGTVACHCMGWGLTYLSDPGGLLFLRYQQHRSYCSPLWHAKMKDFTWAQPTAQNSQRYFCLLASSCLPMLGSVTLTGGDSQTGLKSEPKLCGFCREEISRNYVYSHQAINI